MKSLSDITKSDLLFIMLDIGGFARKKDFYSFFNNAREQYYLENGVERYFNTQRDQFYKWMERGKEIDPDNFNSNIATYAFENLYEKEDEPSVAIKKLLAAIQTRGFDIHSYEPELNALIDQRTQKYENPFKFDSLFSRIISDLTFAAFRKSPKDTHSVTRLALPDPTADEQRIIPRLLTERHHVSSSHVLHRDEMINDVLAQLLSKSPDGIVQKTNVLITGFGGWGKTTVARVVYSKMLDSGCYYSIGWLDYNIDLRNSFLNGNTVRLFEDELDQDKRWTAIKKELLEKGSSQQKILLFIDNVDQKSNLMQFPKEDVELQRFADAPNINMILTSRLAAPIIAEAIDVLEIPALSTEQCVDLFYYYWDEKRRKEDSANIEKLIALAHHHTLALKLLALGAKFRNLDDYVAEIDRIGFNFVIPEGDEDTVAATELRKLFDLKSRTDKQLNVLWDFSVLPQTTLDLSETKRLLGYQRRDLEPLVDEGWLNYEGGGFSLHPLIKTVVHMSLVNGRAPLGTMANLFNLVASNQLITQSDSYATVLRKLSIVENALLFCDVEGNKDQFYYNLGMAEYDHARKRLTSLEYLNKAQEECHKDPNRSVDMLAEIHYQIGYIESTTHKYRQNAHVDLETALTLWESCGGHEYEIDKARDHLGYVLSDSPDTQKLASKLLNLAYESRRERYKREKTRTTASDFATTCDNLGCLLMKYSSDTKRIHYLLTTAYDIRCEIFNQYGDNETEVAWTAYNIGDFLGNVCHIYGEAEQYLRRALEIRREQDKRKPGAYTANIVFTLVALANVIKNDETRVEEAQVLLEEATALQKGIDLEHSGFFLGADGTIEETFVSGQKSRTVKRN